MHAAAGIGREKGRGKEREKKREEMRGGSVPS
jgi:hypothetical protein